jgi:glutaredoxin
MITVYGADVCEDTRRSLRHLRRLGVSHVYQNVDLDPAALERAKALNSGRRRTPVIDLDSEVLVEPSNEALTNALLRHAEITDEEVRERLLVQNVGDLERTLRVAAAGFAFAALAGVPRAVRPLVGLAAAFGLFTGLAGWCPYYAVRGVSSLGGPGDRPDEAERPQWIARTDQALGAWGQASEPRLHPPEPVGQS